MKQLLKNITGFNQLAEKVRGLYYKTESDKQELRTVLNQTSEELRCSNGQVLAALLRNKEIHHIQDAEFHVFSQFGEDGIIQFLINRLPEIPRIFIEFGVEAYSESNTRFLLKHNNWKGLIIDGSRDNMEIVRNSDVYWRHDLTAVDAFITRENINQLFQNNGFSGEIGLLSIDIDGNDYWVWEEISVVNPALVIAEYNSYFGPERAVSVPYDPSFYRTKAHFSNLYFGASLPALQHLAGKKGYSLLGCNKAGNNAFFIRNDLLGKTGLKALPAAEAFVEAAAREARDKEGNLTFADAEERRRILRGQIVVNVLTGEKEEY
jgi:hypothetical protein